MEAKGPWIYHINWIVNGRTNRMEAAAAAFIPTGVAHPAAAHAAKRFPGCPITSGDLWAIDVFPSCLWAIRTSVQSGVLDQMAKVTKKRRKCEA